MKKKFRMSSLPHRAMGIFLTVLLVALTVVFAAVNLHWVFPLVTGVLALLCGVAFVLASRRSMVVDGDRRVLVMNEGRNTEIPLEEIQSIRAEMSLAMTVGGRCRIRITMKDGSEKKYGGVMTLWKYTSLLTSEKKVSDLKKYVYEVSGITID